MNPNKNLFPVGEDSKGRRFSNAANLSINQYLMQADQAALQTLIDTRAALITQIQNAQNDYAQKSGEYNSYDTAYNRGVHPNILASKLAAMRAYQLIANTTATNNNAKIADIDNVQIPAIKAKIAGDQIAVNNDAIADAAAKKAITDAAQNTAGAIVATSATSAATSARLKTIATYAISAIAVLVVISFIIKASKKGKSNEQ